MGSVSAKERGSGHPQMVKVQREETQHIDITHTSVRVDKININGLGKTKNDIILPIVKDLFQATNFGEVLTKSDRIYRRLESLECFRDIEILIDTSKGPKSTKDGIEVTFNVKELKSLLGNVTMATGSDEASLVLGARMPNLLGRAEKIQTEYNYGTASYTNATIAFSKPLILQTKADTLVSVFQGNHLNPGSGYNQVDRGAAVELEFNSAPQVRHSIQWEGAWRHVGCVSRNVPFDVREHSGHSLKSALIHAITMDTRNKKVFPTAGNLFELRSEYAGLGGDVGFLKNEFKIQSNLSLFKDFVLQGALHGGLMNEFNDDKRMHLCDRFFLGGPNTLRGFYMRGAGPHAPGLQSGSFAIGSEMYWAAGLHMYAPLPFRVFEKSFGELFRTHLFVTAGNLGKFDSGRDYRDFFKQMITGTRMSCGIGLALRLSSAARLEFNYCVPLSMQPGDRANRGFQFGVGLQFL